MCRRDQAPASSIEQTRPLRHRTPPGSLDQPGPPSIFSPGARAEGPAVAGTGLDSVASLYAAPARRLDAHQGVIDDGF